MTPRERDAFDAGVEAVRQAAMVAAISIEVRDDSAEIRQRAASAALLGLAEGALGLKLNVPAPGQSHAAQVDLPVSARREAATAQGYTGDMCSACNSFEMKRAGSCLTCQACGSTTGCG